MEGKLTSELRETQDISQRQILLYSDPWVDGNVAFGLRWSSASHLTQLCIELVRSGYDVTVLGGTGLGVAQGESGGISVVAFEASELIAEFGPKKPSGEESGPSAYVNYLLGKLPADYQPDIIIGWDSELTHLLAAYPEAVPLVIGPGLLSGTPFPETCSVGFGVSAEATLSSLTRRLRGREPTRAEEDVLDGVRAFFGLGFILPQNPLSREQLDPEGRYRRLVALDWDSVGAAVAPGDDELVTTIRVLAALGEDTGVVLCGGRRLDGDLRELLRSRFSRVIVRDEIVGATDVHNYLVPLVDGVLSCDRQWVGAALFWGKLVFALADSWPASLSASSSLEGLQEELDRVASFACDGVLAAILPRAAVPWATVLSEGWLAGMLQRATRAAVSERVAVTLTVEDWLAAILRNAQFADPQPVLAAASPSQPASIGETIVAGGHLAVCFDVFGVLLQHPLQRASDVFELVAADALAEGLAVHGFAHDRAVAEQVCRERVTRNDGTQGSAITLDDIYKELALETRLPESQLARLREIELECEGRLVQVRAEGWAAYQAALAIGKRVLLSSESYLGSEDLRTLLAAAGFDPSEATLVPAADSRVGGGGETLLRKAIAEAACAPHRLLIVSERAGFCEKARQHGLDVHELRESATVLRERLGNVAPFDGGLEQSGLPISAWFGLCTNHLASRSVARNDGSLFGGDARTLGYVGLGLFAAGFQHWLQRECLAGQVETVLFAPRAAFLVQQCGRVLGTREQPFKALMLDLQPGEERLACLVSREHIKLAGLASGLNESLEGFFADAFGVSVRQLPTVNLLASGFSGWDSRVDSLSAVHAAISLALTVAPRLLDLAETARKRLGELIQGSPVSLAGCAIADVEGDGALQRAIHRTCGVLLNGYQLFTTTRVADLEQLGASVRGYASLGAMRVNPPTFSGRPLSLLTALLVDASSAETTADRGLMGVPRQAVVADVQGGIMAFLRDYERLFGRYGRRMAVGAELSLAPFAQFVDHPTRIDAQLFANFAIKGSGVYVGPRVIEMHTPPEEPAPALGEPDGEATPPAVDGDDTAPVGVETEAQAEPEFDPELASRIAVPKEASRSAKGKLALANPSELSGTQLVARVIQTFAGQAKADKYLAMPEAFFEDSRSNAVRRLGRITIDVQRRLARGGIGVAGDSLRLLGSGNTAQQVQRHLVQDRPNYLYMPWIANHGDALVGILGSSEGACNFIPFRVFSHTDDKASRLAVNRFARACPDAYREVLLEELKLLRGDVQGFLFTFDWHPTMRVIASVCGELGIPRVLVPHEAVFMDRELYYNDPETLANRPITDEVLCWGGVQQEVFLERGYPDSRLRVVGSPKLDALAAFKSEVTRRRFFTRYQLPERDFAILFAAQPMDIQVDTKEALSAQTNVVLDLLSYVEQNDYNLIVRLPPSGHTVFSEQLKARIERSRNAAIDGVDGYLAGPQDSIYHTDATLSINSTMLLEAALIGRASISTRYFDFEQLWAALEIPVVTESSSLTQALNEVVRARGSTPTQAGWDWAKRSFSAGSFDGKAASRVNARLREIATNPLRVSSAVDRMLADDPWTPRVVGLANLDPLAGTQRYVLDMLGVEYVTKVTSAASAYMAEVYCQWGQSFSRRKQRAAGFARSQGRPTLYLEDGFIRSAGIGLTGEPGLSIILDDMSLYYDATQPSRLEALLQSGPELTMSQTARARAAINRIVEARVSKYNDAPLYGPDVGDPAKKKVLVIDQRAGDNSVKLGMADEARFTQMLETAMMQHPDKEVLVKRHPDAMKGGKGSHFPAHLASSQVRLIDFDVNPYRLFEQVEEVYVVTSGMGFEALMAGKKVHCFGMPFYAGWGLTEDLLSISRRGRKRSLEEVFYVAYIQLSRYYHPVRGKRCEVEDLIEYMGDLVGSRARRKPVKPLLLGLRH